MASPIAEFRVHASLPSERLSRRPLLIGGALLIGLVLGLAVLDTVHGYRQSLADANAGLDNVERLLEEHTIRTFDSSDALLKEASDALLPYLQTSPVPHDTVVRALAARVSQLSHLRTLILVDAEGRTVADSNGRPPGTGSPGERDYFRVHTTRADIGLAINLPAPGVVDPRWRLPLSRRISGPDGAFLGVIVALLEPEHFTSIYRTLRLGEQGVISIFRRDGVVLFRSFDPDRFIGRSLADRPLFSEFLPKAPHGRAWVTGGVDGISRLVSYRSLARYSLVLSVGIASDDILGPWRERTVVFGIAVLIVCLAIAGFVLRLAQQDERQRALVSALADASERANAANRMKSQFLANMSHELRTPLNAIIGFAEVLSRNARGSLNDQQREYIASIDGAGRHLLDLITDVLNFAKIEAGGYQLDEEAFDLDDLLDETVRLMTPVAVRAEVAVSLRASGRTTPLVLRADRRAFKQMLINLQSNAIKFTPRLGRVEIGYEIVDPGLVIRVSDTGIGIAPDQQKQVLEPFTQISNALNRSHPGTGLGLPIVRSLIELHGGSLAIESDVGCGTTILLKLPRERLVAVPAHSIAEIRKLRSA